MNDGIVDCLSELMPLNLSVYLKGQEICTYNRRTNYLGHLPTHFSCWVTVPTEIHYHLKVLVVSSTDTYKVLFKSMNSLEPVLEL